MPLKCFATLLLLVAPIYSQTAVKFAGVDLRVGMAKDGVLAKFVGMPDVTLSETQTGMYHVQAKRFEVWEYVGDLIFRSGKLTRICLTEDETNDKQARTLAGAFYNAVASGEKVGLVEVWTAKNDDANSPIYEVHLVFKDREVVIGTYSFRDSGDASVKTYFPRVRTAEKP